MRTEKRIVVITGGSSGLGLGLLKHFEEVGDIVIDISRTGRDYQCDVSDSTKLKKVFEDIGLKYGGIDILITCALVLFSLFSGRAVYLDIAIIAAMLGIIDTMLVGRYLDRGRWHYDADSDHS